jgi:ABC-2 type transport system ATP-binding protein
VDFAMSLSILEPPACPGPALRLCSAAGQPVVTADAPAIALEDLTRRYGRLVAVQHLSLDVRPGEIFGFLGLNGAGKTTTIRVLLDFLRPTSGRAAVFGFDCQAQSLKVRDLIGYLPGEMGLYADMTGAALLHLLARLERRPTDLAWRGQLLERLALAPADLSRRLREYSAGMKRKIGIVQAFQADPPLLVLDEPTEGLDPLMQERFYELLAETRAKGRTVFLSSHVLSEVERVCDRVAVLRRGALTFVGPVDEMRRLAPRRVRVAFDAEVPAVPAAIASRFEVAEVRPRSWVLLARGPIGELVHALAGLPVRDLEAAAPRLEEVVGRYYGDEP